MRGPSKEAAWFLALAGLGLALAVVAFWIGDREAFIGAVWVFGIGTAGAMMFWKQVKP